MYQDTYRQTDLFAESSMPILLFTLLDRLRDLHVNGLAKVLLNEFPFHPIPVLGTDSCPPASPSPQLQ